MTTIRERIIREIVRRMEATTFQTVAFDSVRRTDIASDYNGSDGSILAVLEGRETYGPTASRIQENELEVFLTFAVPLADDEERQTVVNEVTGDLVAALSGRHQLEEGGDGTGGDKLTTQVWARASEPEALDEETAVAAGTVIFDVRYRSLIHNLVQAG